MTSELFTPEARVRLFQDAAKAAADLEELLGQVADLAQPILGRDCPEDADGPSTPVEELVSALETAGYLTHGFSLNEAAAELRRVAELTQEDCDREYRERPTPEERQAEAERLLAGW